MTATYPNVWRKRHNLTAWILQILGSLVFLALGIMAFIVAARYRGRYASNLTGAIVFVIFSLMTIIFDIIEIVHFARQKLDPVLALVFAVLKTAVWGIYFIIILVAIGRVGFLYAVVEFVISLVLFATAISQLVLSAIFTHRKRHGTLVPTTKYDSNEGQRTCPA